MGEENAAGSFWQSIPGILTASATLLGAVTALFGVLYQAGYFHHASSQPETAPTSVALTPVALAATPSSNPSSGMEGYGPSALTGYWHNEQKDPKTNRPRGRILIRRLRDGTYNLHEWTSCMPVECDWGVAPLEIIAGNPATGLNGLRAKTKLVRVPPNANREDTIYLSLEGTAAPDELLVKTRVRSMADGQVTNHHEEVATFAHRSRN